MVGIESLRFSERTNHDNSREEKIAKKVVGGAINILMRSKEFGWGLKRYLVVVAFSDHASATTIVYADSAQNAWLIAANQFGNQNIVSVTDTQKPMTKEPADKTGALQFWANRFRKFARLATPEPQPTTFADQASRLEKERDSRLLAGTKAAKAKREFQKVASQR